MDFTRKDLENGDFEIVESKDMTKPTRIIIEEALGSINYLCHYSTLGEEQCDELAAKIRAALTAPKKVDVESLKASVRRYMSDNHLADPSIEWTIDLLVGKGVINGE